MDETEQAFILANRVLDKPWIDPDGDICLLARQYLRSREKIADQMADLAALRVETAEADAAIANEHAEACERAMKLAEAHALAALADRAVLRAENERLTSTISRIEELATDTPTPEDAERNLDLIYRECEAALARTEGRGNG